jgi:hypothetical protein
MEAIIRMSASKNKKRFQFSDLPSIEQLNLHVDGIDFNKKLSDKKLIPSDLMNNLVKNQFKFICKYYKDTKKKPEIFDEYIYRSGREWDNSGFDKAEQEPYFKDSEFIFEILEILGLEYEKSIDNKVPYEQLTLPPEILSSLFVLEHDRWIIDRISIGWVYSNKDTFGLRVLPSLMPLNSYQNVLPNREQQFPEYIYILQFLDRYIEIIPEIFSNSGFSLLGQKTLYKKEDVDEINRKIKDYYSNNESNIRKQNSTLQIGSKYHIKKLAISLYEKQIELMKVYFGSVAQNFNYTYDELPKRKQVFFENWAKSITEDFFEIDYSIIPFFNERGKPKIKTTLENNDIVSIAEKIHKRWLKYLKQNGWTYVDSFESNYRLKHSIMLKPYSELIEERKTKEGTTIINKQEKIICVAKEYVKILEDGEIMLYKLNQKITPESIIEARKALANKGPIIQQGDQNTKKLYDLSTS